jgi:hypothetical protein
MNIEQTYLANTIAVWKGALERATVLFKSYDDEQLLIEIAPGRNRVFYILGHLTAMHDRMIGLLSIGERINPSFDAAFLTTPDHKGELPSIAEVRDAWQKVNSRIEEGIANLTPQQWLDRHVAVSEEDFAKDPLRNRLSILLTRTNHLSYHLGQLALARR